MTCIELIGDEDERWVECPACRGEGDIEVGEARINYRDGSVSYMTFRCEKCCGAGRIIEEGRPVDEDDILDLAEDPGYWNFNLEER